MAVTRGPMEYLAMVDGRRRHVRIEPEGDRLRIRVDESEFLVEDSTDASGELALLLDRRPWISRISLEASGQYRVWLGRGDVQLVLTDPVVEKLSRASGPSQMDGQVELRAPMPGTVVDVRTAQGETAEAGAPLVVLEAMKMQNALSSPVRGTVIRIEVEAGQSVEGEALLLVIEPEQPS